MRISLDLICLGIQKYGGISNYWLQLIKYLNSQYFEFELITPKNLNINRSILKESRLRDELVPSTFSRFLPIRGLSDKVLHSSYYRLPSQNSVPLITTLYDFVSENQLKNFSSKIHNFQKKKALIRSEAIICISNSTKLQLQEKYTFDENKLFVTQLGVDQKIFFYDPIDTENNFENNLLFVGNRSGYKRFDLAVESMKDILDLKLSIVGPPLNKNEKKYLSDNLSERWNYLGFLSESSLRKAYSNSFAFIFPSNEEGFGLPILEAMSSGCPVICANKSSFPEIGGNAVLYCSEQNSEEYSTQIKKLMNDENLRFELRERGFQRSKYFSWKNTFDKTIDIYRQFS